MTPESIQLPAEDERDLGTRLTTKYVHYRTRRIENQAQWERHPYYRFYYLDLVAKLLILERVLKGHRVVYEELRAECESSTELNVLLLPTGDERRIPLENAFGVLAQYLDGSRNIDLTVL